MSSRGTNSFLPLSRAAQPCAGAMRRALRCRSMSTWLEDIIKQARESARARRRPPPAKCVRGACSVRSAATSCAQDPGRRGIAPLFIRGELAAAARSLVPAKSVAILTGYPCCLADPPTETDGPLGALAIARALVPAPRARSCAYWPFSYLVHLRTHASLSLSLSFLLSRSLVQIGRAHV